MFFRRLMLMILAILFRMEQRALAGTDYYVYCTCAGGCGTNVLYTEAYMIYSFASDSAVSRQTMNNRCINEVCKNNNANVCFSADASEKIKKRPNVQTCNGANIKEGAYVLKGCESLITSGSNPSYACNVTFGVSCVATSCDSGYYFQSGACHSCPMHSTIAATSPKGKPGITDCNYTSAIEFKDSKGTYHFTNGCNYTS